MRLLGRLRLSRDRDNSTSIDRQREAIEGYAKLHGHEVTAWAEDLDLSRTVHPLNAPELSRWLTDPEKRDEYDGIAVWRLDRLGAGSVNLNWVIQWCEEHKKVLVSVTENLDFATWVGRMVGGVIAGVAEGEVEGTKERTRASQEKLRQLSRWHGGLPPFGYSVEARDDGYFLVVNPGEADVVLEIFDRVIEGHSINSIAADLNRRGIARRRGGKWTATSVRRMVLGHWVRGHRVHRGRLVIAEDGSPRQFAEAIVGEDDWLKARETLGDRSRPKKRKNPPGILLNVLYCFRCGAPMYLTTQAFKAGHRARVYRYWRCSGRSLRKSCDAPGIRAELIEEAVFEWLHREFGDEEVTKSEYVPGSDNSAELERVSRAIAGIRKERDLGLYDGEDDAYFARLEPLVSRKRELEARPGTRGHWKRVGIGVTYSDHWPTLSNEGKRDLLIKSGVKVWAQTDPWITRFDSDIPSMSAMIPGYDAPDWAREEP